MYMYMCVTVCVQVQFQVGLAADGSGMRAVNIVSKHAFLRGYVESIKGQGQVCSLIPRLSPPCVHELLRVINFELS